MAVMSHKIFESSGLIVSTAAHKSGPRLSFATLDALNGAYLSRAGAADLRDAIGAWLLTTGAHSATTTTPPEDERAHATGAIKLTPDMRDALKAMYAGLAWHDITPRVDVRTIIALQNLGLVNTSGTLTTKGAEVARTIEAP